MHEFQDTKDYFTGFLNCKKFGLFAQYLLKIEIRVDILFQCWLYEICLDGRCFVWRRKHTRYIFRIAGHLCGELTGHRWIPRIKANDAELWCFFDLRLNKRLSKQSWGWWFETPSRPLWRHSNGVIPPFCMPHHHVPHLSALGHEQAHLYYIVWCVSSRVSVAIEDFG